LAIRLAEEILQALDLDLFLLEPPGPVLALQEPGGRLPLRGAGPDPENMVMLTFGLGGFYCVRKFRVFFLPGVEGFLGDPCDEEGLLVIEAVLQALEELDD